jgi:hypothetical protein
MIPLPLINNKKQQIIDEFKSMAMRCMKCWWLSMNSSIKIKDEKNEA